MNSVWITDLRLREMQEAREYLSVQGCRHLAWEEEMEESRNAEQDEQRPNR